MSAGRPATPAEIKAALAAGRDATLHAEEGLRGPPELTSAGESRPPLPEALALLADCRERVQLLEAWATVHAAELGEMGLTDLGNARRLLALHGKNLVFVEHDGGGAWYAWDGARWQRSITRPESLAHDVAEVLIGEARAAESSSRRQELLRWASKSASAKACRDMLFMARSLAPERVERFDAKPSLLAFRNGTLDLDVVRLRPAAREDRLTLCVPFAFDFGAGSPRWLRFIAETTGGDAEFAGYLQRGAGSMLQGRVREHKLHIATGPGGSGKSTFAGALLGAFGPELAMEGPPGLLVREGRSEHPTQFAALRGKRLVTLQEIGQGRTFNTELLKRLTGGDRITARRMREDFSEVKATHHLLAFVNHLPRLPEVGSAILRRVVVLPFDRAVPAERQDLDLPEQLEAEAPGIMAWLVEGWRQYQRSGFGKSEAVERASGQYMADSDAFGRFVSECCVISAAASVRSGALLKHFNAWAREQNLPELDAYGLAEALGERDCEKSKRHGYPTWQGIGLLAEGGKE